MREVLDSVELFFDRLTSLHWGWVAIGLVFHFARLAVVSRAWRNVVAACYPETDVRWPTIFGSYVAGVGVNAVVPARAGDALKLYLAKHRIAGATYTTLAMTLVVLTMFDLALALTFFLWALSLGVLPSRDVLPDLGAFDFDWLFGNPHLPELVALFLLIGIPVALLLVAHRVEAFRKRAARGFAALRPPGYYFRHVVPWQALDWSLRLCTFYCFLTAFGVAATLRNALLGQVTHSLSTIFPFSPSGAGTEQALIVYVLRGEAPVGTLIAFSIGMKILVVVANVLVGAAAIAVMLRTLRMRGTLAEARKDAAAEEA